EVTAPRILNFRSKHGWDFQASFVVDCCGSIPTEHSLKSPTKQFFALWTTFGHCQCKRVVKAVSTDIWHFRVMLEARSVTARFSLELNDVHSLGKARGHRPRLQLRLCLEVYEGRNCRTGVRRKDNHI